MSMSSHSRFPTLFSYITLSSSRTIGNVSLKRIGDIAVRLTIAAAVSCFLLSSLPAAENAAAAITQFTDIPPENLGSALELLARDRKLQLIYATDDVGNRHTEGAVGNFSTGDALKRLLKGTGLSYQFLDDKTVTVQPVVGSSRPAEPGSYVRNSGAGNSPRLEDLRLAQANQGVAQGSSTVGSDVQSSSGSSGKSAGLEEILVTAQKKTERLQDVPIPVTVLNANTLVENNQVLLQDYVSSVPGLDLSPFYLSQSQLSLRGIATTNGTPTVGIVVDDVPFGGSTGATSGGTIPDIDPGDLADIEVLRGPQGTLYGANTMGGLIKYVTVDPSTTGYSGRVEAGFSSVYNGAEPGYNFRASANIPISDTFALRVSGYTRQDPGYIDNPIEHLEGVNETEYDGGRLSALWLPSDIISLKLSAIYQHSKAYGLNDVDVPTSGDPQTAGLGDLQQNYISGLGGPERTVQAYSAILKLKLGGIDVTSVTGYNDTKSTDTLDFSYLFGPFVKDAYGADVTGAPYYFVRDISRVTQELRFSGSLSTYIDWLAGGFYSNERSADHSYVLGEDTSTGQIAGTYYNYVTTPTYNEFAGFADLTVHFTDRFDVQLGGRESHEHIDDSEIVTSGPYIPKFYGQPSPLINPAIESTDNVFTYLATPRYRISPDLMVYARLASGYRPGGANAPSPGSPSSFDPDKTQNYEVGIKGDFLDHKLSVDASFYRIDWKNIQLGLINPKTNYSYTGNGGEAKSEGVELSIEARPLTGLTIAGWVSYDDAVLTETFPLTSTAYGMTGDRLPFTSRYSANLSLNQDFPISGETTGFVGGALSYVGDRVGLFMSCAAPTSTGACPVPPTRQDYPMYAKTDLHAGVRYDTWTVNLYANNVTDRRGLVGGGLSMDPSYAFLYITPRTIGLNAIKKF
jgi:iron complex outermembrane recepter protein